MSKVTEIFEEIKKELEAAEVEVVRFDQKGVKASGGRLRKCAQNSKKLWQDLRVEVMSNLKAAPVKSKKPAVQEAPPPTA